MQHFWQVAYQNTFKFQCQSTWYVILIVVSGNFLHEACKPIQIGSTAGYNNPCQKKKKPQARILFETGLTVLTISARKTLHLGEMM